MFAARRVEKASNQCRTRETYNLIKKLSSSNLASVHLLRDGNVSFINISKTILEQKHDMNLKIKESSWTAIEIKNAMNQQKRRETMIR